MAGTESSSSQSALALNPTNNSDQSLDSKLEIATGLDLSAEQPPLQQPDPTQKDVHLREFLSKMDDYAPIIPEAVTEHFLTLAGLSPSSTPLPISRLLALATQKFIADIAADAYQYSRMRSSASGGGPTAAATAAAAAGAGAGAGSGAANVANTAPGAPPPPQGAQQQQRDEKGKAGAHVLGVQRPGFGGGGGGPGQGGAVLTMEDLG
ncbi:hypothetical protein MMC31_001715, partial [Peltigera leucophlebia]|nr:hypothetical protein [Peltigera leucophlebia]